MQNFNRLDKEDKIKLSSLLNEKVDQIGGKNFFLNLIEEARDREVHPLEANSCRFSFQNGTVTWNKVLFKDKVALLARHSAKTALWEDFLPNRSDAKAHKKILNLIRTLAPVEFIVKPKRFEDGSGFAMQAFATTPEGTTYLDPVFEAIFFTPADEVKKLIEFKDKTVN